MTSSVCSTSPPPKVPHKLREADLAALVCGQMCVGAAGLFGALALSGTSGLTACALRMLIAWGAVAGWTVWRAAAHPAPQRARASRGEEAMLAAAGVALAAHFALWIGALCRLSVAASSLLRRERSS